VIAGLLSIFTVISCEYMEATFDLDDDNFLFLIQRDNSWGLFRSYAGNCELSEHSIWQTSVLNMAHCPSNF